MQGTTLLAMLLLEEDPATIMNGVKQIQQHIREISYGQLSIRSRYEVVMVDWVFFTIEGINWNLGVQLQEVIMELGCPVLFIGEGGLSDTRHLSRKRFDPYLRSLLLEYYKLEEFLTYFLPYPGILDYCLSIWAKEIAGIDDTDLLEELKLVTSYGPLHAIIDEQLYLLDPEVDPRQKSLNDFF